MNVSHKNTLKSMIVALVMLPMLAFAGDYSTSTTGVNGYDLVSFHTGKKPVVGNGNHLAVYKGVTYLFASDENKATFEKNPTKYVPAYGGYCAYGVAVGKKFVGDPDVWKIVDGKLYLNLDTSIQAIWLEDESGNVQKADNQWRKIMKESPESL